MEVERDDQREAESARLVDRAPVAVFPAPARGTLHQEAKQVSALRFKRLANTSPGEWTRHDLAELSGRELRALCELLGIPTSGTIPTVIARLLLLGELRSMLSGFESPDVHQDADRLCELYGKRELRSMCASANLWKSGNKKALAIGLLSWRNECRRKGRDAYRRAREQLQRQPLQRALPFERAA